ncbi:hypothetical protein NW757_003092 [Fusarium falciforme]|nr:hypothetical protein NW757_003092 [Fusarium falciforme]
MKVRSPAATKDLIDIQRVALLVNEVSGVGFDTELDGPLRDPFSLEGLEARGLLMKGVFSVAQSGMPDQLSLKGALSLAGTGASGYINLYFAQRDLLNCYFDGQLKNIGIAGLINFGLKKKGLPQVAEEFLGGNVVINNLQLEAVLSDIDIPEPKKKLKSGFFYEASLYIKADSYRWSGYTCIEVHDSALQAISMMSPVSFSAESHNFFRLTRGSIVPRDHSIPRPKGEQYDEKIFKDGPIIYTSNRNPDTWLLISLHLTLLSLDFELAANGDRSGFELEIPKANVGVDHSQTGQPGNLWVSLEGSAKVKPNEMANAKLNINVTLNLELPGAFLSGLQQQLKLRGKAASEMPTL